MAPNRERMNPYIPSLTHNRTYESRIFRFLEAALVVCHASLLLIPLPDRHAVVTAQAGHDVTLVEMAATV
jgi:hypothetical protein